MRWASTHGLSWAGASIRISIRSGPIHASLHCCKRLEGVDTQRGFPCACTLHCEIGTTTWPFLDSQG
jgi:hypothetical protein